MRLYCDVNDALVLVSEDRIIGAMISKDQMTGRWRAQIKVAAQTGEWWINIVDDSPDRLISRVRDGDDPVPTD